MVNSDDESPPPQLNKVCIWCQEYKSLAKQKPYCLECMTKMYRECARCRKPYPHAKYFDGDDRRCLTCQKKYVKERQKRLEKLQQQQPAAATQAAASTSMPLAESRRPVDLFDRKRKRDVIYVQSDDDESVTNADDDTEMRLALRVLNSWKEKKKCKHAVILL